MSTVSATERNATEREQFDYIKERCDGFVKKHGITIETPEVDVFHVRICRQFKSRVQALRWAEKLVEALANADAS